MYKRFLCSCVAALSAVLLLLPGIAASGRPSATSRIAFTSVQDDGKVSLYLLDSDGSNQSHFPLEMWNVEQLTWSPDGKFLAFIGYGYQRANYPDLFVVRADGSGLKQISNALQVLIDFTWSPDGHRLAFGRAGYPLWVVDVDGSNLCLVTANELEYPPYEWSPDGHVLAYALRTGLYIANADGTGSRQLFDKDILGFAWSPNSTQLAFSVQAPTDQAAFYVINIDGSGLRPVAKDRPQSREPIWSPDGQWLAFRSDPSNTLSIIHADGTGQTRVVPGDNAGVGPDWRWSPDSRQIAFLAHLPDPHKAPVFRLMNVDSSTFVDISARGAAHIKWSPDGTQILFTDIPMPTQMVRLTETPDDMPGIYVVNTDGSNLHRLTHWSDYVDAGPVWMADGQQIVFTRGKEPRETPPPASSLYRMNRDGSDLSSLVDTPGYIQELVVYPSARSLHNR